MEPTIHRLNESLIRKIAAGEVIERPASVVKELVENAIDAGARRVRVETGAAGRQLLRVTDDGTGMVRADALLCVERHATSKMSQPSDLFAIATLGFRGEALASVCAVARVTLETRSDQQEDGTRLVIEGGVQRSLAVCGRARGTTIEVRDLFFNTPARRKFLRQDSTEQRHIALTVVQLAAARPEVGFELVEDGRQVMDLLPGSPRLRAAAVLGAQADDLLELDAAEEPVSVAGFLAAADRQPYGARGSQFVIVRGRPVRARVIAQSVASGYGGLLAAGAQAAFVLWLDLDPARMDVNVHPTKREIRFADEGAVTRTVEKAVRGAVRGPASPRLGGGVGQGDRQGGASLAADGKAAGEPGPAALPRGLCLLDLGPQEDTSTEPGADLPPAARPGGGREPIAAAPGLREQNGSAGDPQQALLGLAPQVPSVGRTLAAAPSGAELGVAGANRRAWQLHGELILLQCQDGLLCIDQQAAHERVLYERVLNQMAAGCQSQQLLLPVTLRLTPAELHFVRAAADELAAAGFGIREFGRETVLLDAAPAELTSGAEEAVFRRILAELAGPDSAAGQAAGRQQALAAAYARGAAVTRTQRLGEDAINRLLDDLATTSEPFRSPDGRPTLVKLTMRQLRQLFQRQRQIRGQASVDSIADGGEGSEAR